MPRGFNAYDAHIAGLHYQVCALITVACCTGLIDGDRLAKVVRSLREVAGRGADREQAAAVVEMKRCTTRR
jgi:hypothetical protein